MVLRNRCSLLCTGTDEHGVKIQQAAEKANLTPKQKTDIESLKFKTLFKKADVKYDRFIRTTDEDHKSLVGKVWNILLSKGLIYKGSHAGWYSVSDECFYTDTQITEDYDVSTNETIKVTVESGSKVEWVHEDNYMFACSKFSDKVETWLENHSSIYPPSQHRQALNFFKAQNFKLPDVSISRPKTRQYWGIPVPNDPTQTVYVWFDALLNYLTFLEGTGIDNNYELTHVIGKDILRFHSLLWPSILLAIDKPLPKSLIVHSHWTVDRMKMSKSKGNASIPGVSTSIPDYLIDKYGVDAVRYFIIRDGCLHFDSDYSESLVRMRYQIELADKLGNLLSRCFGKALNPESKMPIFKNELLKNEDNTLINSINNTSAEVANLIEAGNITEGFNPVYDLISEVNKYVASKEPWKTCKKEDEESIQDSRNTIYIALESLRICGILLQPVIPESASKLLDKLAVNEDERFFVNATFNDKLSGKQMKTNTLILFKKLLK